MIGKRSRICTQNDIENRAKLLLILKINTLRDVMNTLNSTCINVCIVGFFLRYGQDLDVYDLGFALALGVDE